MNHEQTPRRYAESVVRHIDRLEEIDLTAVTAGDLIWKYGTGVAITQGTGRYKIHSYRSGVQTSLGDLELSVWIAAAGHVVKRDGLEEELTHLQMFITRRSKRPRQSKRETRIQALQNCMRSIYKDPEWVFFIPYNREYHPEILKSAHLVQITTECCQIPGDVTEEQIARSWDGTICCPVCGRFSAYRRLLQKEGLD